MPRFDPVKYIMPGNLLQPVQSSLDLNWTTVILKRFATFGTTLVALAVWGQVLIAGEDRFQPKGYIQNDRGEKCWYTQRVDGNSTYFHGNLSGTMGIMTFDDPRCMSEVDVGLDVNKRMINNIIARCYSHSDADFQTRDSELFPSSMMQKRGMCIQSRTYSTIGITVDYEIMDDSIIRVRHGMSVQGCMR